MSVEKKSCLYIIVAGILWGIISIFIRMMSGFGFNTMQIATVRMAASSVVFALYLLISAPEKFKINIKDWWMFFCTGVLCIFLHNATYFYGIIYGEISVANVLVYTSPVFVMLVSALVFKEKITKRKLFALILTFSGCICVSGILGNGVHTEPLIVLIGISSGFFYGMYTIFSKLALKKYSSETINMYTFLFSMMASIFLIDIPETAKILFGSWQCLTVTVGAAITSCLLPFFFYTMGLKHVEGSKAAILVSVDPVVGSIIGIVFMNESHSFVKILGILLVLASIVVLNTGKDTKKDRC